MVIQLEFYKNPQPEKKGEEPSYHPRVVNFQHVTTQKLAREIHTVATLGKTEVETMLMELSGCMGNHLCERGRVHLDGIGYFQITLQATEPMHSLTIRADKVKLKSINFQVDRNLKSLYTSSHLRRSKYKPYSASLSEEEIDKKLTAYFATHPVLIHNNIQSPYCFTQSMTSRQIRRLKAQGNLQGIGKPTQPIYVPAPGHYEK